MSTVVNDLLYKYGVRNSAELMNKLDVVFKDNCYSVNTTQFNSFEEALVFADSESAIEIPPDRIEKRDQLDVVVTTAPSVDGFRVIKTLEIVTAECVFGMNVFRDMFAGVRDIFGGRSDATQKILRDARITCLNELKREAKSVDANAVIATRLDYNEFSGGGKSMLFLVASGTAVVIQPKQTDGLKLESAND